MEENWIAFGIAVLTGCSPEIAFRKLNLERRKYNEFTEDMVQMRLEGYEYNQIGTYYGLTLSAVHKRVSRYINNKRGE